MDFLSTILVEKPVDNFGGEQKRPSKWAGFS
jgi:hypothetical protein